MSYPLYLLSCCHGDSDGHLINSTVSWDHLIFTDDITNLFGIISSSLSLLGVLYLLLPRENLDLSTPLVQSRLLTGPSLKSTVLSLFAADVLAAAGILIRSSVWLAGYPVPAAFQLGTLEENSYGFCVALNLWIQYFYMSTYFWNLNFALELFTSVKSYTKSVWPKFLIGWGVPAVLCTTAGVVAYYPDLDRCYGTRDLEWTLLFLSVFTPITIVLIVNPILFWHSSRIIRKQLIVHAGKYTKVERDLVEAIQLKLIFIMTVFVFCWLPNIIAAILEGLPGENPSFFDILQVLWIVMAICNPFQAVLNCLAYYGWPGWRTSCVAVVNMVCPKKKPRFRDFSALFLSSSANLNETTPIVSYRGKNGTVSYSSSRSS